MSSSVFQCSTDLSFEFNYFVPAPVNHPILPNCVIFATDYDDNLIIPGIYQYNLETNESLLIYKYKSDFKLEFHGQCIDAANNLLYLFGNNGVFSVFNLQSKTIKHCDKNLYVENGIHYPASAYIPSPLNELHILLFRSYYIFETPTESLKKSKNNLSFNITISNLVYIPFKEQLMGFSAQMNR
eukprot:54015_1